MLHLSKVLLFLFLFICCVLLVNAQDIIIKNDKTEIQSKVSEITETSIKYKKWDNREGPVYNIAKSEVFMIVYANGQREIIKQAETPAPAATPSAAPVSTTINPPATYTPGSFQPSKPVLDTSIDYRKLKVRYQPARIDASLQSPFSIGSSYEFRIVKNICNIGADYKYISTKDSYATESSFGFIYGGFYAPLNRLTGNYEKQNKGLFPFVHLGYGYTIQTYTDYYGNTQTSSAGGFTWRAGVDWYIAKGFGITLSSYEFKNMYGGLVFEF